MVTDTIGDYLTRIRNAYIRGKREIVMPSSNILLQISKVLKEEGFIGEFGDEEGESKQKSLKIKLRYYKGKPAIRGIKRVSKPGIRIYVGFRDVPKVLNGIGIAVLTTSKGVMTGEKAVERKIGGELLCKMW